MLYVRRCTRLRKWLDKGEIAELAENSKKKKRKTATTASSYSVPSPTQSKKKESAFHPSFLPPCPSPRARTGREGRERVSTSASSLRTYYRLTKIGGKLAKQDREVITGEGGGERTFHMWVPNPRFFQKKKPHQHLIEDRNAAVYDRCVRSQVEVKCSCKQRLCVDSRDASLAF